MHFVYAARSGVFNRLPRSAGLDQVDSPGRSQSARLNSSSRYFVPRRLALEGLQHLRTQAFRTARSEKRTHGACFGEPGRYEHVGRRCPNQGGQRSPKKRVAWRRREPEPKSKSTECGSAHALVGSKACQYVQISAVFSFPARRGLRERGRGGPVWPWGPGTMVGRRCSVPGAGYASAIPSRLQYSII